MTIPSNIFHLNLRKKSSKKHQVNCNFYQYYIATVLATCKKFVFLGISRVKGYRGNIAGDGPRSQSTKSRCLERNRFYVRNQRRRSFIADILIDRVQRKFGLENILVNNATVFELNEQNISSHLATAVNNLIAITDFLSIKFISPGVVFK